MKIPTFFLLIIANHFANSSKLSPSLALTTSSSKSDKDRWDIVVEMEGGVSSVMDKMEDTFSTMSFSLGTRLSRDDKATIISQQLFELANSAQKDIFALVSKAKSQSIMVSSWISNSVFVQGADRDLIERLEKAPGVAIIKEQVVIKLENIKKSENVLASAWNIEKVGAPALWSKNNTGTGIIVGHIDSGVRYTHTSLLSNWMGLGASGGWLDPLNGSSLTPYDSSPNSHGTHTLATAVGINGIGVAPGAKWISCLGCKGKACPQVNLNLCGQFMLCPRKDPGTSKCTGVPHIVTNSWGSDRATDNFYDSIINAWRGVEIIPIFAAGNSGPNCDSLGYPGSHRDVISVGATRDNDALADFSSVGPNPRFTSTFKPDIVAPGQAILSASAVSDSSLSYLTGTSMACPHVAGAVALLLSANPKLTFVEVRNALLTSANRTSLTPYPGVPNCGGVNAETSWPNHKFGYGRLELQNVTIPNGGGRVGGNHLFILVLVTINLTICFLYYE